MERILKKAAVFDLTKLEWLNGQHISRTPPEELYALIESELPDKGVDVAALGKKRVLHAIEVQRERARTTHDLAHRVGVRFNAALIERTPKADKLIAKDQDAFHSALAAAHERLQPIDAAKWEPEQLEQVLRDLAEEMGLKPGGIFQPIRVALTGDTVSEPVNVLLEVVGRDESLRRIVAAQEW